jgi:hypothetical protein
MHINGAWVVDQVLALERQKPCLLGAGPHLVPASVECPPSPEEKIALFDSLFAYVGTYEVRGDRVIHTSAMARSPSCSDSFVLSTTSVSRSARMSSKSLIVRALRPGRRVDEDFGGIGRKKLTMVSDRNWPEPSSRQRAT